MDFHLNESEQQGFLREDGKIRADWQKLTEKQRLLVQKFLKSGNKMASYLAVYYPDGIDPNKTKRSTINANCYKEFRKPHIAVVISQIQERAVRESKISFDEIADESVSDMVQQHIDIHAMQIDALWVLKRAALLADFNIRKFIKVDGGGNAVYDFSEATDDDWYCISEYTVDEIARGTGDDQFFVDRVKLKSFDKLRALELVGKHIDVGAFEDKLKLLGDEANPIQTITRRIIKPGEKE